MPVIESVIAQHAEEAAFLWLLRDEACRQPHYRLRDLDKIDDRIEAHLDGLRIAGDEGWEIARGVWALQDAGEVFAASELAFEGKDAERLSGVLKAATSDLALSRGAVSALGWLSYVEAATHIRALLSSSDPNLRRIGIAASAAHRRDPGEALIQAISGGDPQLRARALRAVGELGRADLLPLLRDHIMEQDEDCRFFACWSAGLFGDMTAVAVLKTFAGSETYGERAIGLAVRRMSRDIAHGWLSELAGTREHARAAVKGYGALGDPAAAPFLVELMPIPELARLVGESFSMITGVDIAYDDLEGERPEGFDAGPTEDPEDENVAMDPDENLPWPDPEKVSRWCGRNKEKLDMGRRYLLGRPIAEEGLQWTLRHGYQRQREAAALELALLHRGEPLFEVRAPGFKAKRQLGIGNVAP